MRSLLPFGKTPSWPTTKPIRFITSFNEMLFEASGRRCLETFKEHNPAYGLTAYLEAETPGVRDAMVRSCRELNVDSVAVDALPRLAEFFAIARHVIPMELGGDAPPEMFPGEGPRTGNVWFRKHMFRWFRKMVALEHAIRNAEGILVWMDCDCFATKPLPRTALERAFRGAGVFYMKGNRDHTETGLVGYDLDVPGVRELILGMLQHYMSGEFEAHPRWDDCYTFDRMRQQPGAPRCQDIGKRQDALGHILKTTVLAPYLEHDKGLHSRKLGLVK